MAMTRRAMYYNNGMKQFRENPMYSLAVSSLLAASIIAAPVLANAAGKDGMIRQTASTNVSETVEAFKKVLENKGATVFAIVDHAKGAEKVDLDLSPAKLVIFGNPKIGTPLMQAAPTMGLDLPLRVLFYEDEDGKTQIVYHDLDAVAAGHGVPADHPALMKAKGAMKNLTAAVAE